MNMAIDESIMKSRIERRSDNTLRLYRWTPSAVSIGKFQDPEKETQLENCKIQGVDVVRRISGGGAVYHDSQDEITYSVIAQKEDLETEDIGEIYSKIYSGLAEALMILGIKADFNTGNEKACPNLTVNGKKISGSSQAHKNDVLLQHGTILTRVNLPKMFTFLRVPWGQTCFQVAEVAQERITSIESETKRNFSTKEIIEALTRGFEKGLNIRFKTGQLTSEEMDTARNLCDTKYSTTAWNLKGRN